VRDASVSVAAGTMQAFTTGRMYYTFNTGAQDSWGIIAAVYEKNGGPGGPLGFPTTDVVLSGDGNLLQSFEHGIIFFDGSEVVVQTF
jgi:uncharacterized protein with LGFP repeats